MDAPRSIRSRIPRGDEHDPNAALSIHDLTVAYDRRPVLWDVDLDVPPGCLAAIVGPNGAGKSTLIKACLDLLPRVSGDVRMFGSPWRSVRHRVAYVPQRETVDWDFPVSALDVVAMGTYGRLGWLRPVGRAQKRAAMEALDRVGLADLSSRQISQLSGGQQQRVFLARALAQQADLYLMDEPFASVDAATEQAIVEVLRSLREGGGTLVVVHHDLQTVAEYFEHVILLNMRVVANGPMTQTLTAENLRATYGGRLTLLEQAATAIAASEGR
ncbi:MAG: ABC transporter ATP-binding protein [Phycisphaerales bacterium]|jgi:manganese/zinc/iron transport system ATP- binding protein|nr:ABC transporter ATP-binding protein [Phycisphaerales bacterium]